MINNQPNQVNTELTTQDELALIEAEIAKRQQSNETPETFTQEQAQSPKNELELINQELARRKNLDKTGIDEEVETVKEKGRVESFLDNWWKNKEKQREEMNKPYLEKLRGQFGINENSETEGTGTWNQIKDFFTGDLRKIPGIKEILETDMLNRLPWEEQLKLSALIPVTSDPYEGAKIIAESDPEKRLEVRRDAKNQVVLRDKKTGEIAYYNKPGASFQDLFETVIGGAAFGTPVKGLNAATPLGKSILLNMGRDAAVESGIQASQQAAGGTFDPKDIGIAAGIGGAVPIVSSGVKSFKNAVTNPDKKIEKLMGKGEDITPYKPYLDYVDEKKLLDSEEIGFPVKTGTLGFTAPSTRMGEHLEEIGNNVWGGSLGNIKELQKQRLRRSEDIIKKHANVNYAENMITSLGKKRQYLEEAAGKKMEKSEALLKNVSILKWKDAIITDLNDVADKLINTASGKKAKGGNAGISRLIKNHISDFNLDPTFNNLRLISQRVGREITNDGTQKDKAMKKVYAILAQNEKKIIKEALPKNLAKGWEKAKKIYGKVQKDSYEKTMKRIFNSGDLTPELIDSGLLSKHESDIKRLYKMLDHDGRVNGRAGIIQSAAEKSIVDNKLDVNKFIDTLKNYQTPIDVFFPKNTKDGKALKGLIKALELTRRSQKQLETNRLPFHIAGSLMTGASLMGHGIPLLFTMLAGGFTSRAYQSNKVNNLLVRLAAGNLSKKQTNNLVYKLERAIQSTIQGGTGVQNEEYRTKF